MNSPQRTNCRRTWYFYLLFAVISLSAASAQTATGHHHKSAAGSSQDGAVQYIVVTPQVVSGGQPSAPAAAPTTPAPSATTSAPAPQAAPSTTDSASPSAATTQRKKHHHAVPHYRQNPYYSSYAVSAPIAEQTPAPAAAISKPIKKAKKHIAKVSSARPIVTAAAPPVAVQPAVIQPVVVPTQPVKALSPLQMTRDAVTPPTAGSSSQPLHDTAPMNFTGQIVRMLGALLAVLLLILGSVHLLRRYNLIPEAVDRATASSVTKKVFGGAPDAPNPVLWMAAQNANARAARAGTGFAGGFDPAASGNDHFKLISSLNLPGNIASVHLVQAANRLLVLGTSHTAGVTLITDIAAAGQDNVETERIPLKTSRKLTESDEVEETEGDDEAFAAFADILREKAGLPPIEDRSERKALDRVDAKLTATQEKLNARLRGVSELTIAATNLTPATPRRRTAKTPASKGREI